MDEMPVAAVTAVAAKLTKQRLVLLCCLGIVDRVFARIGASDNLVQHQSTFMSEMLETAFILAQATDKSLVVVDEIGKNSTWFIKGLFVALLHTPECCTTK